MFFLLEGTGWSSFWHPPFNSHRTCFIWEFFFFYPLVQRFHPAVRPPPRHDGVLRRKVLVWLQLSPTFFSYWRLSHFSPKASQVCAHLIFGKGQMQGFGAAFHGLPCVFGPPGVLCGPVFFFRPVLSLFWFLVCRDRDTWFPSGFFRPVASPTTTTTCP